MEDAKRILSRDGEQGIRFVVCERFLLKHITSCRIRSSTQTLFNKANDEATGRQNLSSSPIRSDAARHVRESNGEKRMSPIPSRNDMKRRRRQRSASPPVDDTHSRNNRFHGKEQRDRWARIFRCMMCRKTDVINSVGPHKLVTELWIDVMNEALLANRICVSASNWEMYLFERPMMIYEG